MTGPTPRANRAEMRQAVAAELVADPSRSNRRIADKLRVSHYLVASVRNDLETGGQIAKLARTVSVVRYDPEEPAELSVPRGRLALSVAETAQALGMSRALIHQACRSGQLHSVAVGKRRIIPVASLKVWLDS